MCLVISYIGLCRVLSRLVISVVRFVNTACARVREIVTNESINVKK